MAAKTPVTNLLEHPTTRAFLGDHDDLMELVEQILETEDHDEARHALDQIVRLLSSHMLHEEGPAGIFEVLAASEAGLAAPLAALERDHARLRAEILALATPQGEAEDLKRMKAFGLHLQAHERRERAAFDAAVRANGG